MGHIRTVLLSTAIASGIILGGRMGHAANFGNCTMDELREYKKSGMTIEEIKRVCEVADAEKSAAKPDAAQKPGGVTSPSPVEGRPKGEASGAQKVEPKKEVTGGAPVQPAPATGYATICVTENGVCQMTGVQVLVGSPCTCTNVYGVFAGIAQ